MAELDHPKDRCLFYDKETMLNPETSIQTIGSIAMRPPPWSENHCSQEVSTAAANSTTSLPATTCSTKTSALYTAS